MGFVIHQQGVNFIVHHLKNDVPIMINKGEEL
jgi:hypothetical protein